MTKEETMQRLLAALKAYEFLLLTHPPTQDHLKESLAICATAIYNLIIIPNQGSMPKKPAKKPVKKQ